MKTFRTLLAVHVGVIGLLTAGPAGLVLAVVGGAWLGIEIATSK
jgi:hypothetical protein